MNQQLLILQQKSKVHKSNKDLSARWFDKECASIKNDLRKLGGI